MALRSGVIEIESAGARLWVEQAGDGPPVLFISGLGYSAWCWDEVRASLGPRFRTITFDNRGTGRSDKPEGPYTIVQLADDAASVLRALEAQPAHVVGHSMGGLIAQVLATLHPAAVASLTLVCTSAGGAASHPVPDATIAAWKAASGLPPEEYARRTMPLSHAPGWAEENTERFEAFLTRRLRFPTPASAWAAQFAACEAFFARGADVRRIEVPALVVHGTRDQVVPFENGRMLAERLPHGELAPMEGAGHLCFLEEPHAFARILSAHLERTATAFA